MEEIRRTIKRRINLIEILRDRLDTLEYDNCPIGYCLNEDCTDYKKHYHDAMKSGMLEDIKEIERTLELIKKTLL